MALAISVLDLAPVPSGGSAAESVRRCVELARMAERLGYVRCWYAEHHGMPSVASSSPEVLIASVAAQTRTLHLGAGGVMLPNHAPLAVAEQFALLEAAAPGRIDLGIGRAPGSDPVTSIALRADDVANFPRYLDEVAAMMRPAGVRLALPAQVRDSDYVLKATPAAVGEPRLWLLGSSMYSAHLAAAKGLPYVFAHHFSGQGTEEALAIYRSEFEPADGAAQPVTFLTVNACVADTRGEAEAALLPNLQMMARLRTGQPLGRLDLVEDAQAKRLPPRDTAIVDASRARAIVGTPAEAADQLRRLTDRYGVDEVMLNPVGSAHRGTDPASAPARVNTLELLAKELL